MKPRAYIISYFGRADSRKRRIEVHDEQIDFFKSQGFDVTVCAMDYDEADFRDGVDYIIQPKMPPGAARNVLLREFYKTDLDWAVFADNDGWWYTGDKYTPTGKSIQEEIDSKKIFEEVDALSLMDGRTTAYSTILEANKDRVQLKVMPQFRGVCFFLANLKKKHNEEVFFSDNFIREDGTFVMGEDLGFALEMVSKGMKVFQCQNVVLKEKCAQISTWVSNQEERKLFYDEMNRVIMKTVPGVRVEGTKLMSRDFYVSKKHPPTKTFSNATNLGDLF